MNAIISAPHGADPLLRGTLMRTSSITPSESLPIGPLLPMYQLATRATIRRAVEKDAWFRLLRLFFESQSAAAVQHNAHNLRTPKHESHYH